MFVINFVTGLEASKHSLDFNYYNYYASKHTAVKAGKKCIIKYQRKSLLVSQD